MECPRCGNPMRHARVRTLELDYCPGCRLLWLDRGELEALLQLPLGELDALHGSRPSSPPLDAVTACPRCAAPRLQPGRWRHIPMALCGSCSGILMDGGAVAAARAEWADAARRAAAPADEDDHDDPLTFEDVLFSVADALLDFDFD